MSETISRIGIIGCGLMGAGIAEVCAKAGSDVIVVESDDERAKAGRARLEKSLTRAQERGKIDDAAAVLERVQVVTEIASLADRQLVIEAIIEDEQAKVDLFARLDEVVTDPEAILASNTSSIPIVNIAGATSRPQQVMGVHFFNPVPVLRLVELVPALTTADATLERAREYVEGTLGKEAIVCQDRAGFVVNSLLIPFILSAMRMYEGGFATAEDIDKGMVLGAAHPQGPLALADLIGLDTCLSAAESMYAEYKEPLHAPPALLRRMVSAGHLGRKSGKGFYDYS